MTCTDCTYRAPAADHAIRFAALAAVAALAAIIASALWSAHTLQPRPGSAPAPPAAYTTPPYVIAKIGVLPAERPESDIPYGR